MNATQMSKMIGRTGELYTRGEMTMTVSIVDVKTSYGSVRYQVAPVAGCGTAWVDANSISLHGE